MDRDVSSQINQNMPVICSEGGEFGTVDHVDANDTIKLTKDDEGNHHWIPISWVTEVVDDQVHIDRSADRALEGWLTEDPNET